jgi:hypothetical protein
MVRLELMRLGMPPDWQRNCHSAARGLIAFVNGPALRSPSGQILKDKDGKDMPEATWKPHEKHGRLTMQSDLPDSVYAFPKQRKEPLTDAQHVRNAVARFDQVIDVSDADRALAFTNIEKAANYYDVNLAETSWHDLGIHPQKNRREAAAKGAVTRERRVQS